MRYVDPDGREVRHFTNKRIEDAINLLYSRSETFKNNFDKLLSKINGLGQDLFVDLMATSSKYAGNTVSQDSPLLMDVMTYYIDEKGTIQNSKMEKGKNVQAIILTIDFSQIDSKQLNMLQIISEEVVHAAKASEVGTEAWNVRAKEENQLPYFERKEENRAKEIVERIMEEIYE